MVKFSGQPVSNSGYNGDDFYRVSRTSTPYATSDAPNTLPSGSGRNQYPTAEAERQARPYGEVGKITPSMFPVAPGSQPQPDPFAPPQPNAQDLMGGMQLPWMNKEKGESIGGVPGAGIIGGGIDFLSDIVGKMPVLASAGAMQKFEHLRDTPDAQLEDWERDLKASRAGLFGTAPDSPVMQGKQIAEVYKAYQMAEAHARGSSAILTEQPGTMDPMSFTPLGGLISSYNTAANLLRRGFGQVLPTGDQFKEVTRPDAKPEELGEERQAIREQFNRGEINEDEARDMIATSSFALSNPDPVKIADEFGPVDTVVNAVLALGGELITDPLTYPTLGGAGVAKVGSTAVKGTFNNIVREVADAGLEAAAKQAGKTLPEYLATAAGDEAKKAAIKRITAEVEEEAVKDVATGALTRRLDKAGTEFAKQTGKVRPEDISMSDRLNVLTRWGADTADPRAGAITRGIQKSGNSGTLAIKAEPVVRLGTAIDTMTDPFSLFGYWRTGRTVPLAGSKQAAHGFIDAIGWRVARRLDMSYDDAGIVAETRQRARDIAAANHTIQAGDRANTARMVSTNSVLRSGETTAEAAARTMERRPGDIRRLVRKQVDDTMEFVTPAKKGDLKAATQRWKDRAAQQLVNMGATPENARRVAQKMDERQMRALANDHWGFVIDTMDTAKRAARGKPTAKWTVADIDRVTFMGPTQMAQQDARQIVKDIASGDVNAVRTAVRRFKDLNLHVSEGLPDSELMDRTASVLRQIDDALPVRIEDMTDMPTELVDFARAHPDYPLMKRPRDEDMLRGVRDEATGRVTGAHSWIDNVTTRTPTIETSRLKAVREELFRGITGGELETNAQRRFAVNMAETTGLSPMESRALFDAIRTTGELSGEVAPRGLTADQIYRSVAETKLSAVTKKKISKRVVTDALVDAYENEMRLVGVLPKATGKAKTIAQRYIPGGESVRWVSDHLYPLLRFKKSPLFFMQEAPEGPFFLALQGRYPISSVINALPGGGAITRAAEKVPGVRRYAGASQVERRRIYDDKTMTIMDRMNRTSNTADYDMYESHELIKMGLSAAADITNANTPLGRMLEAGGRMPSLAQRKSRSIALAARYEFGQQWKRSVMLNSPESWLAARAYYPDSMSDDEMAIQWITDLMVRADPDSFYGEAIAGAANPSHIGRKAEVSDKLVRHYAYGTDDMANHTWDDLVRDIDDGTVSMDQVRQDMLDAGADPDYVRRAEAKLTFGSADSFYEAAVDYTGDPDTVAAWRRADTEAAGRAGIDLHEYLARRYVGRPMHTNQMGNIVGTTLFDDIVENMRVRGKNVPATGSYDVEQQMVRSREMITNVLPTRQADGTLATQPINPQMFDDEMGRLYEAHEAGEITTSIYRARQKELIEARGVSTGRRFAPWGSHDASRAMTGRSAERMGIGGYVPSEGGLNDEAVAATDSYLTGIAESRGTDMPLYSGQRVQGRPLPAVGETLDLPLTATAPSRSMAHGFSRSMDINVNEPGYVYEFGPGTRATAHSSDEFVTAGRFDVESVEDVAYDAYYGMTGHPDAPTVKVVKLRQAEVFDPASGKYKVAKAPRSSASQKKAAAKVRSWIKAREDREVNPFLGAPPSRNISPQVEPARFGRDARGNATVPDVFESKPGYVYRTVRQKMLGNDWRVGEFAAKHPAAMYAEDDTFVVSRVREDITEWEEAIGGAMGRPGENIRATRTIPAAAVEVLGADGKWHPAQAPSGYPEALYQTELHTVGMLTPEQYRRQIVTMMDPAAMQKRGHRAMTEQDALKAIEWYDHIRRAQFALVDESLPVEMRIDEAARLLVAFGTTQLNTSPADGFRHVFKAMGMRTRGETLQLDEARNIVQQAVGLNPEQLQNLIWNRSDKIDQMGIAQKLFDFIDSLTGSKTRTNGVLGPNGNWGPVAVDIHTKRDFGFLDPAMGDWVFRLVEREMPGGELVHGVKSKFISEGGKIEVIDGVKVDNRTGRFEIQMSDGTTEIIPKEHIGAGVPTNHEYDYGVELANDIRDHFNETKFMGREWSSYEVQALGWYRMQLLKSAEGDAGEVSNALYEQSRWMGSNDLVPSANAPLHEVHNWDLLTPENHRAVHVAGARHASDEAEMMSGANVLTRMDSDAVVGGTYRPAQTVELMTDPTGAEQYLAHALYLAEQDSGVLMRDYVGKTRTPRYHEGVGISVDIPATDEAHARELLSTLAAEDGSPLRAIGSHTFIARAVDGSFHLRTLWEPGDTVLGAPNRNEFNKALKASGLVERLGKDHPEVTAKDTLVDFISLKHDWAADPTGKSYTDVIERGSGKHGVMRTEKQRAALVDEYDAAFVKAQENAAKARRMKDDNPQKEQAVKDANVALKAAKKEMEVARAAPGGRRLDDVQQLVRSARVRVRDTVGSEFDRYASREVRNERERVLGEARDAAGDTLGTDPTWDAVLDTARASNGERLYERTPGGTVRAAIARGTSDDRRAQLYFNRGAVSERSIIHELLHDEFHRLDDSANRVIAGQHAGLEGTPYGTWTPGTPLTEEQHEWMISQGFLWASDPDSVHPTLAPLLAHLSGKLGSASRLKTEATEPTREVIKKIDGEIAIWESKKPGKSPATIKKYDQRIAALKTQRQAAVAERKAISASGGLSPAVKQVLDDWAARAAQRTEDRASTYSTDEADMLEWAQISMGAATRRANDLVNMRGARSAVERSINHPFLGLYPSSYMYGKVLPYMTEFLMAKPFGIKAPMLAWTMGNSMNQSFQRQQQYDEDLRAFLYKNEPMLKAMSMFVPGLPWDMPSGLPFWMRRGIENMLTNNVRALNGEAPEDFDWGSVVLDSAMYNLSVRGPSSFEDVFNAIKPFDDEQIDEVTGEKKEFQLGLPQGLKAVGAMMTGEAPQPPQP